MTATPLLVRRPVTLDAITAHTKAVIEAHAGTGKTYTIEHLVVDLLLSKEAYLIEEILIVTFTDKAARELRERIRALIERVLYGHAATTTDSSEPHWRIDSAAETRLKQALFSFELAQISTIHSFCQRILKEAAFFSGGLMNRTLTGKGDLFDRAFAASLRETFAVNPEFQLPLTVWLEQKGTLAKLSGLLAGAVTRGVGSGHSSASPRLACHSGTDDIIAGLTKLQSILLNHVSTLRGRNYQTARNRLAAPLIDTNTHPNAARGGEGFEAALRDATIPSDTAGLLNLVATRSERIAKAIEELPAIMAEVEGFAPIELVTDLQKAADIVTTRIPLLSEFMLAKFLPPLYEKLASLKANEGMADFDDLLSDLERALHAPGSELAAILRGRFRVALIDEFQDTDLVQWSIFRRIFFESPAERLYLVGDPKQAIYAFRGADVGTYLLAAREVVAQTGDSKANLIRLGHNYRSSAALIEGYNLVLSARGTFFQGSGIRYDQPVLCGNSAATILDESGHAVEKPLRLFHLTPPNGRTQWQRTRYQQELYRTVGDEILRLTGTADGTKPYRVQDGKKEWEVGFRDIYILTEKNGEAAALARVLKTMGIPCSLYQTGSIFATDEAFALAALMGAILNPHHRGTVSRALLTPFFNQTLDDLEALWADPEHSGPMRNLLAWHQNANSIAAPRLLQMVLSETALIPRLLGAEHSDRAVTNTLHLMELMERWHAELGSSLGDLHERLEKAIAEDAESEDAEHVQRIESDASSVKIFTMHKSKGLEAPIVFLCGGLGKSSHPGIETVTLPDGDGRVTLAFDTDSNRFAAQKAAQSAEERERLLYVALTRAGRLLYLPYMARVQTGTKKSGDIVLEWDVDRMEGVYETLATRLWQLTAGDGDSAEKSAFALRSELRTVTRLPFKGTTPGAAGTTAANGSTTQTARTGAETIPSANDLFPTGVCAQLAALLQSNAAPRLASYTKLKHAGDSGASNRRDEPEPPAPPTDRGAKVRLPAGAEFGICFHGCMEDLDLTLAATRPLDAWSSDEAVRKVVGGGMKAHGINLSHTPYLLGLIHTTINAPIRFSDGTPELPSIAGAQFVSREIDFFFPWPELWHAETLPFRPVDRGLMQGCCDVLFAWQGRHFVLDWKTDLLPDYGAEVCQSRVREQYELQAAIYSIALVRMLAVQDEADYDERVGGYLYTFVRGPTTFHGRFSWQELKAFEQRLAAAPGMRWEVQP
jgi:exodeoxyribonuclease V beta subunit